MNIFLRSSLKLNFLKVYCQLYYRTNSSIKNKLIDTAKTKVKDVRLSKPSITAQLNLTDSLKNKKPDVRRENMIQLAEQLRSSSVDEALMILEDKKNDDDVHKVNYVIALEQLASITENFDNVNEFERYKHWLWKQPGFFILLKNIFKKCEFYNAESTLAIYRYLKLLQFPDNSFIMKANLQLLKTHINNLDLDEVVSLYAMLDENSKDTDVIILRNMCKMCCDLNFQNQRESINSDGLIFLLTVYGKDFGENFEILKEIFRCLEIESDLLEWDEVVEILLTLKQNSLILNYEFSKHLIDIAWNEMPSQLTKLQYESIIELCKEFPQYLNLSKEKIELLNKKLYIESKGT